MAEMGKFVRWSVCAVTFTGLSASVCHGAGFSNFTQGAGSMGVANATVAHNEGVSSIFYNPSLQLDFEGGHTEFGVTLVVPKKSLDSSVTGQTYESEDKVYPPLHFAASYRLSDAFSFALTVNNSFGLGSEYAEDTVFRYVTTSSELTTWDINPTFAWKPHEILDVAFGFRAVRADTSLEQMFSLSSVGLSDGRQQFEADGTGYGWNIGLTVKPAPEWSIGLAYRSKVDIDLSGSISYEVPIAGQSFLTSLFQKTSASSDITLPAQAFAGVAYHPSNKWVVEAAVRWEQYSSYDTLTVTAGSQTLAISKNWSDVWAYMMGVSYQTEVGYRLSAGYLYEETPVPEETFEPGASGLDKHTLTAGLGKEFGPLSCRVSFAYDFYQDREIENAMYVMNGTHSQDNYSLALTLGWTF